MSSEVQQLATDLIKLYELTSISPLTQMPREGVEFIENIAKSVAEEFGYTARISGSVPDKPRPQSIKTAYLSKLDELLSKACITNPFREYLRKNFEMAYDSGMRDSAVDWLGINIEHRRYGIFDPVQAVEVERSFVEDLPRTVRQMESLFGPKDEKTIYYSRLLKRWGKGFQKKTRK